MIVEAPKPTDGVGMVSTSSLVNPATQELTLVSPTAVATDMPTITLTPEPTSTKTEVPTATEMIQTIDMTKLYHMPDSWEDMLAHPENNVVAPFNPRTQPEEFMKWYDEVYVPALGDLKKLEVNTVVDIGSIDFNMIGFYNQKNHPFGGEMTTFIIEDGEMKYLVVVVTLRDAKDVNDIYSVAVITTDFLGNDGAKTIDVIREGKRKFSCVVISTQPVDSDSWPDNVNEMIKLGLDGRDPSTGGVRIGFGAINFFRD